MSHDEMSETFKKWNEGELDSFLIEISANILNYRDEAGDVLLEKIKDSAGQKGTGKNAIYHDGLFGIVTLGPAKGHWLLWKHLQNLYFY